MFLLSDITIDTSWFAWLQKYPIIWGIAGIAVILWTNRKEVPGAASGAWDWIKSWLPGKDKTGLVTIETDRAAIRTQIFNAYYTVRDGLEFVGTDEKTMKHLDEVFPAIGRISIIDPNEKYPLVEVKVPGEVSVETKVVPQ